MTGSSSLRAALVLGLVLSGGASLLAMTATGCGSDSPTSSSTGGTGGDTADPGALIKASMTSQVGVVLDEIPEDMRDKVVASLQAKDEAFWIARARAQINMTKFRLVFRTYYYPAGTRMQLTLPPDVKWVVALKADAGGSTKPRRVKIGTHDAVVVDYTFESTLLSPFDSPGITEPELAKVGASGTSPSSSRSIPSFSSSARGMPAWMRSASRPTASTAKRLPCSTITSAWRRGSFHGRSATRPSCPRYRASTRSTRRSARSRRRFTSSACRGTALWPTRPASAT